MAVKVQIPTLEKHSDGSAVTKSDRQKRAKEIAENLCSQSKWLTHGRSIKIKDLETMGLKIMNYDANPELKEAISRYYILLRMCFEASPIYKIFETVEDQIYRYAGNVQTNKPNMVTVRISCMKCLTNFNIQADLRAGMKAKAGSLPYPVGSDIMSCPKCHSSINLRSLRQKIEAETGLEVV